MAEIVREKPQKLSTIIHDEILNELKTYFFVGGMPEAVLRYAHTHSIKESIGVYTDIAYTYRQDFSKYTPKVDTQCLDQVFLNCSVNACQQVKYVRLAEGHSIATVKKALLVLNMAKVVKNVRATNAGGLPLGNMASDKIFKPLVVDLGFVHALSGLDKANEYQHDDLLDVYRGQVAEQYVGQELLNSQNGELYYWSRQARNSNAEVDYLVNVAGKIVPVEVKNQSTGHLKSLTICLNENKHCPYGLVFSGRPYSYDKGNRIKFVPLYYVRSATKTID